MKTSLLILLSLIVSSVCFGGLQFEGVVIRDESYSDRNESYSDRKAKETQVLIKRLMENLDQAEKDYQDYQFKKYASIGFVCVVVVGVLFLCFKFRSSITEFATPLKWFMLLGFNLLLFLFLQDGSSRHTFPALVVTFITTILSFGYLFGFKKKT